MFFVVNGSVYGDISITTVIIIVVFVLLEIVVLLHNLYVPFICTF